MPQSSKSSGSPSLNEPYAPEGQPSQAEQDQQQSEALHNANDLARLRSIDADIDRLYQERDILIQRMGFSDFSDFLSKSEAEEFKGNKKKTRPTWTMLHELIRKKNMALKASTEMLEREAREKLKASIEMNRCVEEKQEAQQKLLFAQSEISMMRLNMRSD